ncbi:NUDIX hydrolase domain-like protein [Lasiosphaeris hirsuta]|uniref:NUDIX hydrolase domain-like protein n=1 Tax=Lasiosphaeris hirsuta TaxID=260670 RepID=A0AA40E008_9PEZI|nr:NUDIX hydrolase domain-like protein [Lasiosphaeris hirsuta]
MDAIHINDIAIDPTIDASILTASRQVSVANNYSPDGQQYDKFVVGAAIFRYNTGKPRLLLLKRGDNEAYFPGVFEIPGGKVDFEDASIRHAAVREAWEETGLVVTAFRAELKPMLYSTEKVGKNGEVVLKRAIQLNYVVSESGSEEVVVSEGEHSENVWAAEEDLRQLRITDEMREVVREEYSRVGVL